MKTVTISNGIYMGKSISGTFNLIKEWYPEGDLSRDPKEGKVKIEINGAHRGVWVNKEDISYNFEDAPAPVVLSDEEIAHKINKRFSVMDKMANGVVAGVIRSLIISGAPGVGKTYSLEKKLGLADSQGKIDFDIIKGKISPIGLYIKLFENRDHGCVTVLDDIDVFSNEDTLNILKAALDTGERRVLSWGTASTYLEEKDIPNNFEFQGSIIFVTNVDIDRELSANSKITPHVDALVSRSIYLDLAVHTNKEIMIRVKDVIKNTSMMEDRGLAQFQIDEALEWLMDNVDRLRNVSLRTALFLADFILTSPEDWRDLAETTMLRP